MELSPYLDALQRELHAAAAPGGAEVARTADLLSGALDAAARLCLLEALSTPGWSGRSPAPSPAADRCSPATAGAASAAVSPGSPGPSRHPPRRREKELHHARIQLPGPDQPVRQAQRGRDVRGRRAAG